MDQTNKPTKKQLHSIKKVTNNFGIEFVTAYLQHFYPNVTLETMSKLQAQKIITGLQHMLPRKNGTYKGKDLNLEWIKEQK